jgi:CheY-like chemotaxis protein
MPSSRRLPSAKPRFRPARESRPHSPPLANVRVLVVEDDAASRKLAMVLLAACGAQVRGVASAEEAVAAIAVDPPEVAVVDLMLPRMGGLALIEQLQASEETQSIVLVAVTSMSGRAVERVALRSGCSAYVQKPIDTECYAATVAACVGGKQ